MFSVRLLIWSTALDFSMASLVFIFISSKIASALLLEEMVVLWSRSALPFTCTEVSCPSFESFFISSVFCLIPSMLPLIMDALAVVSCMPAAISCVVAELSSAISLFACMMESSLSIPVRMVVSAAVMSPISSRNTFLISLTAPAITPVSSLRFTRDSPDFVFWKSRSAV